MLTEAEERLLRVTEVMAERADAVVNCSVRELSHRIAELRESVDEWLQLRAQMAAGGARK